MNKIPDFAVIKELIKLLGRFCGSMKKYNSIENVADYLVNISFWNAFKYILENEQYLKIPYNKIMAKHEQFIQILNGVMYEYVKLQSQIYQWNNNKLSL